MKAAVLTSQRPVSQRPLEITDVADPQPKAGHVLLRVRACGVCRTDLHIVEGELTPQQPSMTPGHQIVGEVGGGATEQIHLVSRVRVSWLARSHAIYPCFNATHYNPSDTPTCTGL